jgi:cobalt/nickel transport system permease protein
VAPQWALPARRSALKNWITIKLRGPASWRRRFSWPRSSIGPASAHLILNGLVGLMLGWGAFPAILVALVLQAVLFQFGGITTLGVNTVIMALPAVICHYLFSPLIRQRPPIAFAAGCACGVIAVLLSALLAALALIGSQTQFTQVAMLLAGAHLPVMIIEGLVTGFCIAFLLKVKPSLLQIQEDTP